MATTRTPDIDGLDGIGSSRVLNLQTLIDTGAATKLELETPAGRAAGVFVFVSAEEFKRLREKHE